jgi:hypothetical protein
MSRRPALAAVLAMLLAATCPAADDPYASWSHGRPQDALPGLLQRATADGGWDAWLDLGLAAAAAGDARATAWLLEARARAPEREEPRAALRALGATLPTDWFDRLGPLAWPGCGWPGVAALAIAGLALGLALTGRGRRGAGLAVAGAALVVAAPGQLASWHDGAIQLVATVRDTRLLDSAGNPGVAVAAGTVAVREPQSWPGRVLVLLPDGRRGYLPLADTQAGAGPR